MKLALTLYQERFLKHRASIAKAFAGVIKRKLSATLLIALFLIKLSNAAIVIDTAITTESTCQANGVIKIMASGNNVPFIYSITDGPVTRPSQSSNSFFALPAGTYTVQAQSQTGETATRTNVIVTGTYQLMTLNPLPVLACSNASNGSIIGNLVSGGVGPYTWQLVAPSPVTTAPQASDTFYNLPDGSYTMRVTDNCGNFQTTGVILSSQPSSLNFTGYSNYLLCGDSGKVQLYINYVNLQLPMTVRVYDDIGDSCVFVIDAIAGYLPDANWYIFPEQQSLQITATLAHSVFGGTPWHAVITNPCGVTLAADGYTATYIYPVATGGNTDACPPGLGYAFSSVNNYGDGTLITKDTIKYYLFDITLNAVTDSGTGLYNAYVTRGIAGHTYKIILINTCGLSFTSLTWVWADPAPPTVYTYPVNTECLDSTISMQFSTWGFSGTSALHWVIKSGPPIAQSTKPGFSYSYQLSYPDSFISYANSYLFELKNLPPGYYTFSVEDSCGERIDSSFTILPSDVNSKDYTFNSTIIGQCGIFNAINLAIHPGNKYPYSAPIPHFTYTITNISTGQIIETNNVIDSVNKIIYNVPNGTYVIKIDFFEFPNAPMYYLHNNDFCTTIFDTIIVKGSPFPYISDIVNSFCKANITTQIIIDSTGGVAPYTYEVISGPQTFPPQTSNVFQLPSTGTYTFRVVDACGNSYVSATGIDTLNFPDINLSNTPCPGANVLLIPVVSPFYKYNWKTPSGNSFTGDTLNLTNVSSADTGVYTITRYADISGCKDTLQTTLHLEMLARVNQTITSCYGDTVRVGNYAHTATGTYIDTLTAAGGCDSIVTTHINLIAAAYSEQTLVVCQNQPIIVGPHIHYISDTSIHVIYDTIPTSTGCDSIVTTHITIKPRSSALTTVNICEGNTLMLPVELYSQGNIIIDTVAITSSQYVLTGLYQQTNGCDSSIITQVVVSPTYFKVLFDTICAGEKVINGPYTHTQTGGYLDSLTTGTGCDSIILLILTVTKPDTTFFTKNICQGQFFNGHNSTGFYTDTLQNINGCDSIVILNLTVSTFLHDSITRQICAGESVVIANHSYTQSDIYRDTVATINCDSIITLNLMVTQPSHDTVVRNICSGQNIITGTHIYNETGIYTDTFATANCDSIVVLHLTVNNYKTDTINISFCEGDSITIGPNTYSQSGVYSDTIVSEPCDSIAVFNITALPVPVIKATASASSAFAGNPVQLNVVSDETLNYFWASNGMISNPIIQNPVGTIITDAWFIVSGVDTATSCRATDSVFISLLHEACNENSLYIPNAFSPNTDGTNDVFKIYTICSLENFDIKIFNRWGEKVFESEDPAFKWNGYYKSELQSPSVFVYYLQGVFENGEQVHRKGSVTLIR